MDKRNIEQISRNISDKDKAILKEINSQNLKERISKVDLSAAAQKMRELGLSDAANKLDGMSNADIINQISKTPEILDKLKNLFK